VGRTLLTFHIITIKIGWHKNKYCVFQVSGENQNANMIPGMCEHVHNHGLMSLTKVEECSEEYSWR